MKSGDEDKLSEFDQAPEQLGHKTFQFHMATMAQSKLAGKLMT